jgi:P4 family phage/plasmid primase-like protien
MAEATSTQQATRPRICQDEPCCVIHHATGEASPDGQAQEQVFHPNEVTNAPLKSLAAQAVTVQIKDLSRWPRDARQEVFRLIAQTEQITEVTVNGATASTLLEALTRAFINEGSTSLQQQKIVRSVSVEAAALTFHDAPEQAADHILASLKRLGASAPTRQQLIRDIRQKAAALAGDEQRPDPAVVVRGYLTEIHEQCAEGAVGPVVRWYRHQFYGWTGRGWVLLSDDRLQYELSLYYQRWYGKSPDEPFLRQALKWLRWQTAVADADEAAPFYRDEASETTEPVNVLIFENGVLDLDQFVSSGQIMLSPLSDRYFSPNCVPHPYKHVESSKRAREFLADAPRWNRLLDQLWVGDALSKYALHQFIGYTLLNKPFFHRMLMLIGPDVAGKAAILEVIEALLGHDNVSHYSLRQLADPSCVYDFSRKRVNIQYGVDPARDTDIDMSLLTRLVSGNPVDARDPSGQLISLEPDTKLIVAANELPNFQDTSSAVWRLMFPIWLAGGDEDGANVEPVDGIMEEELPHILRQSLMAVNEALAEGALAQPKAGRTAMEEQRVIADPVLAFFNEYLQYDERYNLHKEPAYQLYCYFVRTQGGRRNQPISKSAFCKRIKSFGVEGCRPVTASGDRERCLRGVALSPAGRNLFNLWRGKVKEKRSSPYA